MIRKLTLKKEREHETNEASIAGNVMRDLIAHVTNDNLIGRKIKSGELRKKMVGPPWKCPDMFTMTTIEELGLLKMDFLGLRTLTVIQDAMDLIEKRYGKKIQFDQMPMDDPEVYQMISAGKTVGVFQLESAGMTSFMKELRPENLEDIIAGISLYRPGPMDFIPKYLEGKKNAESIQYTTPLLEPNVLS